jgi:hypothetical protein
VNRFSLAWSLDHWHHRPLLARVRVGERQRQGRTTMQASDLNDSPAGAGGRPVKIRELPRIKPDEFSQPLLTIQKIQRMVATPSRLHSPALSLLETIDEPVTSQVEIPIERNDMLRAAVGPAAQGRGSILDFFLDHLRQSKLHPYRKIGVRAANPRPGRPPEQTHQADFAPRCVDRVTARNRSRQSSQIWP